MDVGVTSRQFLDVYGILSNVFDLWVRALLEDVDNVCRLSLDLNVSLFLFGSTNCFCLDYTRYTPAKTPLRTKRASLIIIIIN